jgi:hypothetical protein
VKSEPKVLICVPPDPARPARPGRSPGQAGRDGGTLTPGRYIDYNWKKMTPLSNLYVEMLNRMGISTTRFGDSTGGLAHLA